MLKAILRRATTGVVLGAVFSVAICACGATGANQDSSVLRVSTGPADAQYHGLAGVRGILEGMANSDGTACFWLGTGSETTALMWPYGYTAREQPLAVFDGAGNQKVIVGQRVNFAGDNILVSDIKVKQILGCPGLVRVFVVGAVER